MKTLTLIWSQSPRHPHFFRYELNTSIRIIITTFSYPVAKDKETKKDNYTTI
jgi:hypothetical protein